MAGQVSSRFFLRALLISAILLAFPAVAETPAENAMKKAAAYLWAQQAEDGSWPSKTYGVLKTGQALTPFVLNALMQVPEEIAPAPKEKVEKALAYVRKNVNADGVLGLSDPLIAEYPNYATALAVVVLARTKPAKDSDDAKLLDKMVAYLKTQQLNGDGDKGWKPSDPAFGAWGYGGVPVKKPDAGHADLSVTRYVLEALRAWKQAEHDGAFKDARRFLARLQNLKIPKHDHPPIGDGGFFFSTVLPDANKAGKDGDSFKSYGTATADGVLALRACKADSISLEAAERWLLKHHQSGGVPGVPADGEKRWDQSIRFYYTGASAPALRGTESDKDWRKPLREFLLKSQREDGSFVNDNLVVKEDDPLIATPLALIALIHSR
ncbi:MAG TPA: prenyltransferase/squalene oxidase repeat-containing protein [Planctomycetota bacterium]|nr:prenyltransferase/squalene oxidase repeat-containing protein [Planctomycetota bacterium]